MHIHNSNLLIDIYQYAHSDFMVNQIMQDCCDCLVLPWKYRGQFVPAEVGRQNKLLDMQREFLYHGAAKCDFKVIGFLKHKR